TLRDPSWLGGTDVCGPENGAHDTLGRNWVVADKIGIAHQHAAEVLRPGVVDCTIEDRVSDVAGTQLLRLRRDVPLAIDLTFSEKLFRRTLSAGNPIDLLDRVKPYIGGNHAQEHVITNPNALYSYTLAFEVYHAADAFAREQLEARGMNAGSMMIGFPAS